MEESKLHRFMNKWSKKQKLTFAKNIVILFTPLFVLVLFYAVYAEMLDLVTLSLFGLIVGWSGYDALKKM